MWFIYAVASTLFASIRRANEKQLAQQLSPFTSGWLVQLLALPVLLIGLVSFGTVYNPFDLPLMFWLITIGVSVGFYPLNSYLYMNAMKDGELSKILPLQSFGPIFSLALAWLLVHEAPTPKTFSAIGIIVFGVYILNAVRNPFKIIRNDKPNRYMLLSLMMSSLVAVFDKIAIQMAEPLYFSFVCTVGAVLVLYVSSRLHSAHDTPAVIKKQLKVLVLAGTLLGLTIATYMLAIATGPIAYVSAVRTGGIVIGACIGFVVFKEAITKQKLVAMFLIILGSLLLI